CGGTDHIDVHHTNEIAQSEAATGRRFFNYWMHGAFLIIAGGKKMAKSEGNFLTLDSSFTDRGIDPLVYRFATFQTHYRKPMEYGPETVEAAQNGLQHLRNQVRGLREQSGEAPGRIDPDMKNRFLEQVNDDLNMPRAMATVQELLKSDLSAADRLATVLDFDRVLGLDLDRVGDPQRLPEEIEALAVQRKAARDARNWAESDRLRDEIQARGYLVQDTKDGMKVFKP
ncbi:MAG: cysteine--tRNA ligase, partial [Desulfobacterales bacterium]